MRTRTPSPDESLAAALRWPAVVLALLLAAGMPGRFAGAQASGPFRVIVHPAVEVRSVERAFLSRAFLKKSTRWPDGTLIRPVDQLPGSRTRNAFTRAVHDRSIPAVRNYWQQAIFAGTEVPPPELNDDAAVIAYVLSHPGAIGYVSPDAELGGAAVIELR